jgi:hypothetical protein
VKRRGKSDTEIRACFGFTDVAGEHVVVLDRTPIGFVLLERVEDTMDLMVSPDYKTALGVSEEFRSNHGIHTIPIPMAVLWHAVP